MYLAVPGFEPTSSVFLGEYVIHQATVADDTIIEIIMYILCHFT